MEQKNAILQIFDNNVNIVCGRAGTGKSSVIASLIKCINEISSKHYKLEIILLTPTAKAKNRLIEIMEKNEIEEYNIYTIQHFYYK